MSCTPGPIYWPVAPVRHLAPLPNSARSPRPRRRQLLPPPPLPSPPLPPWAPQPTHPPAPHTGWDTSGSGKRDHSASSPLSSSSSQHTNLDSPALWAGNWQQLCVSCRIVRPLRAKHDAVTDRCIEVFDHYCPWVGHPGTKACLPRCSPTSWPPAGPTVQAAGAGRLGATVPVQEPAERSSATPALGSQAPCGCLPCRRGGRGLAGRSGRCLSPSTCRRRAPPTRLPPTAAAWLLGHQRV
jgi:hypothetical protein